MREHRYQPRQRRRWSQSRDQLPPPLFRLPPLPTPSRVCEASYIAVCAHRIRLSQQTSRLGNRLLPEKSCLATTAVAARARRPTCVSSLPLTVATTVDHFFCQHRHCIAGSIESHSEGKVIKDIVSGDTHVKNIGASVLMNDQSVCQSDLCRRACIIVHIYFNQRGYGGGWLRFTFGFGLFIIQSCF